MSGATFPAQMRIAGRIGSEMVSKEAARVSAERASGGRAVPCFSGALRDDSVRVGSTPRVRRLGWARTDASAQPRDSSSRSSRCCSTISNAAGVGSGSATASEKLISASDMSASSVVRPMAMAMRRRSA